MIYKMMNNQIILAFIKFKIFKKIKKLKKVILQQQKMKKNQFFHLIK